MRKIARIFLGSVAIFLGGLHGTETSAAPPIPRIGVLIPEAGRSESHAIRGLRDELKALGYREDKNIVIEIRDAKGNRGALKLAAEELVAQKVRIIVTTGTRATLIAKSVASDIPLVFIHPADPVALGLVKSLDQPEGNRTGVAGLSNERTEKRMEILREVYPEVRRLHIFYDQNDAFSQKNFLIAEKAALKLALEVSAHPIKTPEEFKISLNQIQKQEGDAVFHIPDNIVEGESEYLFAMARQKRLPTMFHEEQWVIKGALAAYGPSYYQMGRQAAGLVNRVLQDQKPRSIPIERASQFDLSINYRTGYLIGHIPSRELLKRADKVIR